MNKLKLASITALLFAGASVAPAFAVEGVRSVAGEATRQAAASKGPYREDDGEERRSAAGEYRDGAAHSGPSDVSVRLADRVREMQHYGSRDGSSGWSRDDDDDRDGGRDWSRDRDGSHDRDRDWSHGDRDRDGSHGDRHDWRNDRHDWHHGDRRDSRYYTRYRDSRWSGFNWHSQYRYRAPSRYYYPSGYSSFRWSIGYRMPYSFYSTRGYWLDWRMYRLPMPPYGYQWVRVDRDVVLVHLSTGYVRDVLYGVFY